MRFWKGWHRCPVTGIKPSSYSNLELFAECPATYKASRFFNRYLTAFLPSHYSEVGKKLSRRGFDFFQLWAWDSDLLMRMMQISEKVGDVGNYTQNRSKGHLNG